MKTYRITSEVNYLVEAESLDEALKKIEQDTEFPIIGANSGTYCESDRIVKYELARVKKTEAK